jgi:hypothetical protein
MSIGKELILRILFFIVIGVVAAALFNEVTFRLQGNSTSDPQTIQLVILMALPISSQGQNVLPAGQVFYQ